MPAKNLAATEPRLARFCTAFGLRTDSFIPLRQLNVTPESPPIVCFLVCAQRWDSTPRPY